VAAGARVTGVCSAANVDLVASLGAEWVVDYTAGEWVSSADHVGTYDTVIDNVGNHSIGDNMALLADGGIFVMLSGPKDNPWTDPMVKTFASSIRFKLSRRRFANFTAAQSVERLQRLSDLVADDLLRPVIARRVTLDGVPDAMAQLATGHARAKLVVEIADLGPDIDLDDPERVGRVLEVVSD
jgi:NADPH:quinone reductase-like Zn-dependent oxidoreductase